MTMHDRPLICVAIGLAARVAPHLALHARRLTALACLGLLGACASAPPPRLYTLELPAPRLLRAEGRALAIGPVRVPESLERPQLMVLGDAGQLQALPGARWAQPLRAELAGALAAHLADRLDSARVLAHDSPAAAALPHLALEVVRCEHRAAGESVLEATWSLRPPGATAPTLLRRSLLRASPARADAAGWVEVQGRLVAALASDIAAVLASTP